MNLTITIYFILLFECSFENGNNEQVVLGIFSDFEKDILLLMETEDSAISKLELFLNSIYPLIEKLKMNNIQNDLIDFQVISQEAFQHYLNEFKNKNVRFCLFSHLIIKITIDYVKQSYSSTFRIYQRSMKHQLSSDLILIYFYIKSKLNWLLDFPIAILKIFWLN
uniref:Uncharacterized protein n=1 Tax=Meloidogyne enterolobii TaxID=390850 RepID=A0A6V7VFT5_MELEN|nr:unnamed protein product [Meloidogyne enterolobii]